MRLGASFLIRPWLGPLMRRELGSRIRLWLGQLTRLEHRLQPTRRPRPPCRKPRMRSLRTPRLVAMPQVLPGRRVPIAARLCRRLMRRPLMHPLPVRLLLLCLRPQHLRPMRQAQPCPRRRCPPAISRLLPLHRLAMRPLPVQGLTMRPLPLGLLSVRLLLPGPRAQMPSCLWMRRPLLRPRMRCLLRRPLLTLMHRAPLRRDAMRRLPRPLPPFHRISALGGTSRPPSCRLLMPLPLLRLLRRLRPTQPLPPLPMRREVARRLRKPLPPFHRTSAPGRAVRPPNSRLPLPTLLPCLLRRRRPPPLPVRP